MVVAEEEEEEEDMAVEVVGVAHLVEFLSEFFCWVPTLEP